MLPSTDTVPMPLADTRTPPDSDTTHGRNAAIPTPIAASSVRAAITLTAPDTLEREDGGAAGASNADVPTAGWGVCGYGSCWYGPGEVAWGPVCGPA